MLVYPSLRRWIGGSVKQPFSVLVGAERFDFGLVTTDFFEAKAWPTDPNFNDPSWGHAQRNSEAVVVYPFF
jgi:hypothetical protein